MNLKIISSLLIIIAIHSKSYCQTTSNLFIFDADERVFTAFAFMNAAGFDGEWRDEGMNPVRIEIREHVKSKLDSTFLKKMKNFHYSRYNGSWCGYADYALLTNGPPDFEISYDSTTTENVKETVAEQKNLSVLLSQFYQSANIKDLWKKYESILNKENNKYRQHSEKALDDITNFCRINKVVFLENIRNIHFMICPQMSYYTAQQNTVNGDLYIIHGPSEGEPSPAYFYHEALHEIINPLTEKHIEKINTYEELLQISNERRKVGYKDWNSIVNESFVRTIDKILQGKLYKYDDDKILKTIIDEYKLGFVLCLHIYESLNSYVNSNQSIEAYLPEIIAGIDIEKEKNRWNNFWENNPD